MLVGSSPKIRGYVKIAISILSLLFFSSGLVGYEPFRNYVQAKQTQAIQFPVVFDIEPDAGSVAIRVLEFPSKDKWGEKVYFVIYAPPIKYKWFAVYVPLHRR